MRTALIAAFAVALLAMFPPVQAAPARQEAASPPPWMAETGVEIPPLRPLTAEERAAWIQGRIDRKSRKGAKDPYDQPAEAAEFFVRQRSGAEQLDYGLMQKAREARDLAPRAGEILQWNSLGPGLVGGRTRAILIDPNDPQYMIAGGVAGGIFISQNAGGFWFPYDQLMENLAITSLAYAGQGGPNVNPNIVYAGTGEGFFNSDAVRGAGIFKSTDRGETWTQLPNTNNSNFHYVNKVVASPNDTNRIYAATRTGVWRTTDGGQNWTRVLANTGANGNVATFVATPLGIMDLAIRTDMNPDVVIASAGSFTTDGIYRSTNGGTTWSRVFTTPGLGRTSLAIAPSNQNTMYALGADNANGHRLKNVYRSTNGGQTWTARVSGTWDNENVSWLLLTNALFATFEYCNSGFTDQYFHQGWYDNAIAVAPHNENVVFAGGIDAFRSDDGGATWGILSYWWESFFAYYYMHADIHTFVFHPDWDGTSNTTLFTGSDGGITRSTNALGDVAGGPRDGLCIFSILGDEPGDVAWVRRNQNYVTSQFYHGAAFPAGQSKYFGGLQDNGTWIGEDATGSYGWSELIGGDGTYVSYHPANTDVRFGGTTRKSLRRATNGVLFENIASDAQLSEASANFAFIAPHKMHPGLSNQIFYGGKRPWRSNNAVSSGTAAGVTWTAVGQEFPARNVNETNFSISAWAIDRHAGGTGIDRVYAGTSDGRIFAETSNNFATNRAWTQVTASIPAGGSSTRPWISWIEADPNNSSTQPRYIYATQSVYGHGHVFQKIIQVGGAESNWIDITSNLPDMPVHCIRVQPGFPNHLYIGTDLGVWVSFDRGGTWMAANDLVGTTSDFANTPVEALEFQTASILYAFTHGRGAWRAFVSTFVPTPTPTPSPTPTPAPTPTVSGIPNIDIEQNDVNIPNNGTFDFGPFQTSRVIAFDFALKSTGTGQLFYPEGIVIQGTHASQFSVTQQPAGIALSPGFEVPFTMQFAPTSAGNKTAQAVIDTNDPNDDPFIINLTGVGETGDPTITISEGLTLIAHDSTYTFPDTGIGESEGVAWVIRNTGTSTLRLLGDPLASVVGTHASNYAANLATDSIPPGGFTVMTMEFEPSTTGLRSAQLRIQNNDFISATPVTTYRVNLRGTGVSFPDIRVLDNVYHVELPYGSSVQFPPAALESSSSYFFGIANDGDAPLVLAPVREERVLLEGAGAPQWEIFYYPDEQEIIGGISAIGMRFKPTEVGTHTAQVLIPSNDPDENPYVFNIIGTAVDLSDPSDMDGDGFTDAIERFYGTAEDDVNDRPDYGDYTGDGVTDLGDALALAAAVGGGQLNPYDDKLDMNFDGRVNFDDAEILYAWSIRAPSAPVIPMFTGAPLVPPGAVPLRRLLLTRPDLFE